MKFDLKIRYYKNVVFYEPLYTEESLKGTGVLFSNNGFYLCSQNVPQITRTTLYLPGLSESTGHEEYQYQRMYPESFERFKAFLQAAWLELNKCEMPKDRFVELSDVTKVSQVFSIIERKKSG